CGFNNACAVYTCASDTCSHTFGASGMVVANPTPGDCRSDQCDGLGHVVIAAADDNDRPADDGNDCTDEVCMSGVPSHPPLAANTPCEGGIAVCDGLGACGECTTAAQCPGSDTACSARVCISNTCGVSESPAGTIVATQVSGDCQVQKCDGLGNVVSYEDD